MKLIISEEREGDASMSNTLQLASGGGFSADENSTIAPGTIRVTAQVSVSFILQ